MNEWKRFRIGLPGSPAEQSPEGCELDTVYHVAHFAGARCILEDGVLKTGLVRDKSRLRKSRIAVTWLSAT